MGFGDKLTATTGSGKDNLTASLASGKDNLTASLASGQDNLFGVSGTLITQAGQLSTFPSTINVISTVLFPSDGEAYLDNGSNVVHFIYSGKTATTLTGCEADSGTHNYNINDKIISAYGLDVLAASTGSGKDNVTVSTGSGKDNLYGVTGSLVTQAGQLSTFPSTINVISTALFPSSGEAYLDNGSNVVHFVYSGKTATTLTGCEADSGTHNYNINDKIITTYGLDILAASTGSGKDNVTASTGSGKDNVTASTGSGKDNLYGVTGSLVTQAGQLSTFPSTINIISALMFPFSGSASIDINGQIIAFTYTGKTATTLTGCEADSGSYEYNINNKVTISE